MPMTVPEIIKRKHDGRKITMLTAYDYQFARLIDEAGIDIVLVGDSLGTGVQGHPTTLPVTMDEMIYHTKIVSRGVENALVVGDMPFMSYQASVSDAVYNAGRFIKEGAAAAVKVEGGSAVIDKIRAIIASGIPVMGHVGLLPQSVHQMGGYKVQGREDSSAEKILSDSIMLEDAGVFAVVLEGIPAGLAEKITNSLSIPAIGIGAGVHCDGQVLVINDILGSPPAPLPNFRPAHIIEAGFTSDLGKLFKEDVENGKFPSDDESY